MLKKLLQTDWIRDTYIYLKFKLRLPRDTENMQTTLDSVRSGAVLTGANLWVLVTAVFIASLGLNVNSTAVIIGAMLISPLMGPIMAIGMGVAIHDFNLVNRAFRNFLLAVTISIITSSIFFFISPLKETGSELLARTTPTIYDVLIAIFGGLAGIIAGSSKLRQSNVIPGVAIATALMPPLCTVGFGIANLNFYYVFGALYLFFINTVFISLSTYIIVKLLKYPFIQNIEGEKTTHLQRIIWTVVIVTLLPSIYLTYGIVKNYIFTQKANSFVNTEFAGPRRVVIKTVINEKRDSPLISVTLLGPEMDSLELEEKKGKLVKYGLQHSILKIQQGFGDVTQKGALIGGISKSIQLNSQAIASIYVELDSLRKLQLVKYAHDTLLTNVARQLKDSFPELISMKLEETTFFDLRKDTTREGYISQMRFSKNLQNGELLKMKTWLSKRLDADTIYYEILR